MQNQKEQVSFGQRLFKYNFYSSHYACLSSVLRKYESKASYCSIRWFTQASGWAIVFCMLLTNCVACIPQNSEIFKLSHPPWDLLEIIPYISCRPHLLLVLLCDNDNEEQLKLAAYIVTMTSLNFVLPTLHWPHLYLIRKIIIKYRWIFENIK